MSIVRNVLGSNLVPCCQSPVTGFFRDGYCATAPEDLCRHVVCAVMDESFLSYSKSRGNDLSTPNPAYGFPGLKPGDRWCVCAARWQEALQDGFAPQVVLEATDESALEIISLSDLKAHALDGKKS